MGPLRPKILLFCLPVAFLLLGPVNDSSAENTSQCHCFTNRSYNPADRFAADDYILATSFNSLLAKAFNIPKRQIVMIKMEEGMAQDELLVALKISKITGVDLRKFLRLRHENNNTWPQIISGLAQHKRIRNDKILEAIKSGMPVEEAGVKIADEIIGTLYQVSIEGITELRMSGLNEKEMALVFILAYARNKKVEELVHKHNRQGMSWSEIANDLGVEPAEAGKLILAYPVKQVFE